MMTMTPKTPDTQTVAYWDMKFKTSRHSYYGYGM